jgi:signal transduction histidine kinase
VSATALQDPPFDAVAPARAASIRQGVRASTTQPPSVAIARPRRQKSDLEARQHALTAKSEEIDGRLARQFMTGIARRHALGIGLAVAMATLFWRGVPAWGALAWMTLAVGVFLVKKFAARRYVTTHLAAPAAQRDRFLGNMSWVYVASGLVWASCPLLFLDRVGEAQEFACWAVLGVVANAASFRLALVPRLHRAFTNTFYVAIFAFFAAAVALPTTGDHPTLLFAPICMFQFWISRRLSKDVYRTQRALYSAQYDLETRTDVAEANVKEKSKFLAAATHDMRQPVIAMGLYAEFLESDPSSHDVLIPKINRAAAAVNALFSSLFDVTSLDSGHHKLKLEPVSLTELLSTLRTDYEPLAQARQLELRVRGRDAMLLSDGARLRRLVGNVLSNAIKYSRPEGKVLVAIRQVAGKPVIEVWDQGVGIAASQIENVFDEFYRADGGRELSPDGMGIGLALVSRLAEALKCSVTIASSEGTGTRVTIALTDLASEPAAGPRHGPHPSPLAHAASAGLT